MHDLRITTRMVMLWFIATVRYCYMVAEQPQSSLMTVFPYIVFFQKLISKFIVQPLRLQTELPDFLNIFKHISAIWAE